MKFGIIFYLLRIKSDAYNLLCLSDSVGSDRPVEEEDTLKTKEALRRLGRYDTPDYGMTPYPDAAMFNAIGKFQSEKNL